MALPRFTLNLARLDLVSVRLAVACAQTGSLTAAARECNLALAAASRRLKELELALGVRLFERRSSGLIPTTAAAHVIKRGLDMLGAVYELESTLADLRDGIARHVRLCASSAAINQFLPPLLARWHAHHPQVQVEVEEQVSGLVLTRLQEGRADIGVFVEGPPTPGLRTWPFREDELVLVFPSTHRLAASPKRQAIAFADLIDEQWISLGSGAALFQAQQQSAVLLGRPLKIRMQLRSFDAVCHMVEADMGIAILPKTAVMPSLQTMKLGWRRLADPWARRRIVLATPSSQADPVVLELIEFLRETAPEKLT